MSRRWLWVLAAILALAAFVRLRGIEWGLPTASIPHAPYHPDETWAMSVLRELDPAQLRLNPVDAHREGTLAYYLWMLAAIVLRAVGAISAMPSAIMEYGTDYRRVLLGARIVTQALDLGSVAIVFLGLRRVCGGLLAPAFGALALAVAPFEVVYAHYMRTHIVANFFLTLAIFLSLEVATSEIRRRRLAAIGLACGFAAAAKYPAGAVALVPLMFLVARRTPYRDVVRAAAWIGSFAVIGFVLTDPFLLLQFQTARAALTEQASYVATEEFGWRSVFDLSRLFVFFTYLIPYGSLPALWVLFYAAAAAAFFTRSTRPISIPLAVFIVIYLYPMAKGYFAAPIFIRAGLQVFPVFAFLVGFVWHELESRYRGRAFVPAAAAAVICILFASFAYDVGYSGAMRRGDARDQLREFLAAESSSRPITVAYYGGGHDYFLVKPAIDTFPAHRVRPVTDAVRIRRGLEPELDFLVLTAFEPGDEAKVASEVHFLEATGRYRFLRVYSNPIRAFGVSFDYPDNPHDLQYPLQKLYLLAFDKSQASLGPR